MCKVIQVSNECFEYVRSFQTTEGSCKYKKSQKGSIDPDFFRITSKSTYYMFRNFRVF